MRARALIIAVLVPGSAGCFEEDVGSNGGPLGIHPSNGVTLAHGIDADEVTTLTGYCDIDTEIGTIECEGLIVRANEAGVVNGIGYQRLEPVASNCAGDAQANAPAIGVFSFGSLVIEPGAAIHFKGGRAAALVTARSVELGGTMTLSGETGGFDRGSDLFATLGPAAALSTTCEGTSGAAGAGGSTEGGAGGNDGGARTPAAPPQFEPLCGGSTGGNVADRYPGGGSAGCREGGAGGGAILVAAGERIQIEGAGPCGIAADGAGGMSGGAGGSGGGAGGTISLEAPTISVAETCWVTAVGGGGSGGGCSTPDEGISETYPCNGEMGGTENRWAGGAGGDPDGGDGGDGGKETTRAQDGSDGAYGGGGGGAAGFIRLRTNDCTTIPSSISPSPSCETL